jgi:Flp pilus assembly protein TadD
MTPVTVRGTLVRRWGVLWLGVGLSASGVGVAWLGAQAQPQASERAAGQASGRAVDTLEAREEAYRANNLGVAYLEQYNYELAAKTFRRALEIEPGLTLARVNLAIALLYVPDLAGAAGEAQAALQAEPDSRPARYVLGLAARGENRVDEGMAAFQQLLTADPDDAGTLVNLGQLYLQERKFDEASGLFRRAMAVEPFNATATYNLAVSLMRAGKQEEGQKLTAQFQQLRESGHGITYANTYLEQGRYGEALASTGAEPELVGRATPTVTFTRTGTIEPEPPRIAEGRRGPPGPLGSPVPAKLAQSARLRGDVARREDRGVRFADRGFDAASHLRASHQRADYERAAVRRDAALTPGMSPGVSAAAPGDAVGGFALADVDGDGALDIVDVSPTQKRVRLLHNVTWPAPASSTLASAAPATDARPPTMTQTQAQTQTRTQTAAQGQARVERAPAFADVSTSAGLGRPLDSGITPIAAIVGDYDNDRRPDIFVLGSDGHALLRQTDTGQFENQTVRAGLTAKPWSGQRQGQRQAGGPGPGQWGSAAFVDVDHDGDLDIVLAGASGDVLLRNNGDGTFTDTTTSANLAQTQTQGQAEPQAQAGHGIAIVPTDYDNRRDIDLLFLYGDREPALFRNMRDGTFHDEAVNVGLASANAPGAARAGGAPDAERYSAVAAGDVNKDGFTDFFFGRGSQPGILFLSDGNGRFRAAEQGPAPTGVIAAQFLDYDNDGLLDLVGLTREGLFVWRNLGTLGDGAVASRADRVVATDVTAAAGGVEPAASANSRPPDTVSGLPRERPRSEAANANSAYFSDANRAIVDRRGGYIVSSDPYNGIVLPGDGFGASRGQALAQERAGAIREIGGRRDRRSAILANVSLSDATSGSPSTPFGRSDQPSSTTSSVGASARRPEGAASWVDVSDVAVKAANAQLRDAGVPSSMAAGDLDGDGDTDLIIKSSSGRLTILTNQGGSRNTSLRVRLVGQVSNRGGVGAKIDMRAGSLRQKLEVSSATPAIAPADLTFGLGARAGADVVRVLWPSGTVQAEPIQSATLNAGASPPSPGSLVPAVPATSARTAPPARAASPPPGAPATNTAQTAPQTPATPAAEIPASGGASLSPATAGRAAVLTITELDRKPSSCPFLYTWNGDRFEFITDFMGGGEMGYLEEPGVRNVPDPEEFTRITSAQLRPRDGRFELRVTNELEETLFVDRLRLLAIAHPASIELYPREGLVSPPFPGFELIAAGDLRTPVRVIDHAGRDVTDRVRARDRRFIDDLPLDRVRGYAKPHDLTIDMGDAPGPGVDVARREQTDEDPQLAAQRRDARHASRSAAAGRRPSALVGEGGTRAARRSGAAQQEPEPSRTAAARQTRDGTGADVGVLPHAADLLLLTGWTDYAFSSDNIAASHAGLHLEPPSLAVRDASGAWHTVIDEIGIPVGRPQTIVIDLKDKWLSPRRLVRIHTSMRVYWDQIQIGTRDRAFESRLDDGSNRTDARPAGPQVDPLREHLQGSPTSTVPITSATPADVERRTSQPAARTARALPTPVLQLALSPTSPDAPSALSTVIALEPLAADLRWRGFSAEATREEPFTYDYARINATAPWKQMPGRYTREGDVRELLRAVDDMFVISRPGDEIALSFDATSLPPLPAGWTRTFLLHSDGFSKEMDLHSASPDQAWPLPFHAMTRYPYAAPEAYPFTPERRAYIDRYNTRIVSRSVPSLDAPIAQPQSQPQSQSQQQPEPQ